jgi:hypothetical protein
VYRWGGGVYEGGVRREEMTGKEAYFLYAECYDYWHPTPSTNAPQMWDYQGTLFQATWNDFVAKFKGRLPDPIAGSTIPFDLTALLKRYGRHNPRCATGFDCSCGWDEAVKLVGLEGK